METIKYQLATKTINMPLRRSTHMYCMYCATNLHDYGQTYCDKCLLPFDNSWIISCYHDVNKLSICRRIQCTVRSMYYRSKKCLFLHTE